jgi:L-arabinose isomerase
MNESEREAGARIGLFSIGLDAYWPQFPGLRDRLIAYNGQIASRLQAAGCLLENLGLIDTPERAREAGRQFRTADVDLIFLHVSTYALSSTVLPAVRRAKVPVIVLNLAPGDAIDYAAFARLPSRTAMTAEWLAWCQACSVPEIANVFTRAGIAFHQVTGTLDDSSAWSQILAWMDAARVAAAMEQNRVGLMGHYYGGMLDIYTDLTLHAAVFGCHFEMIEVDELSALRERVKDDETKAQVAEFGQVFELQPDCDPSELRRAARTAVALDRLAERYSLGALAYYYKGAGTPANEDAMSSIILGSSVLTGRHIPVAGEYEVNNVQAMKILDLFGAGGSFTEYYAVDFRDDVLLMGHDGPGHIAIADGRIRVCPLQVYHGKVGVGLSVEMSVRTGPVTLLSVVQTGKGTLEFLTAEGEAVPGPTLPIGNTNSRYRFPIGARGFLEAWNAQAPAHHCAVGVGHLSDKIQKLACLLGIKSTRVC